MGRFYVDNGQLFFSNVQIDTENVYDVLEAADIFLLPDLKRQCGAFLENYREISNVIDLVNTARLFVLPRLEHACVEFIAKVKDIVSMLFDKYMKV